MENETLKKLMSGDVCDQVCNYLSLFSNPGRLKVLCRLNQGEAHVGDIVEFVGQKQSTVSQHLRHLLLAGVVTMDKRGTRHFYSLADGRVKRTLAHLSDVAEDL